MLLVILAISIALVVVGLLWYVKAHDDTPGAVLVAIGCVVLVISVIALIDLGIDVSSLKAIDDQIAMYYEENAIIEEQIATTVKQYQNYETEIFTELKPESSITLVSLYPELKSDTLVQSQIEVYTQNNAKIKELKERKITANVKRWWLYFGG